RSDRVTIVWPGDGVRNGWLEVTVKANERTGLSAPDVFSFGNLVGDTGPATGGSGFAVDASDVLRTRLNLARTDPASLQRYDFNRDGLVNSQDLFLVRVAQSRHASLPLAPAFALASTSA